MIKPGNIISYTEMCAEEGTNLQRGMNYRLHSKNTVILMSLRPNAPYEDRVKEDGKVLIYEGHDIPRQKESPEPKKIDQPMTYPSGKLTQNGLFFNAAVKYKNGETEAELVKVYEKIRSGIWVYNGLFKLIDARQEETVDRKVFKFRLEITEDVKATNHGEKELEFNRLIPTSVKLEVWKRDKGKCVKCGSKKNLHFDHIIPYSKGGTSLMAENIQLLCAKHNIAKKDKIE